MSQFSKEPPWVRDKARSSKMGGMGMQQSQMGMSHQGFSQQPMASSTMYALPQPGIALPTSLATSQVGAVSYPTPRSTSIAPPSSVPQQQQKVFTGVVTKFHDNFGFIDDDVFFQMSCVKGGVPQIGEHVVVEASYNASMPFKWNATRVQRIGVGQSMPAISQPSSGTYKSAANQGSSFPSVGSLTQAAVAQVGAVYQAAAAAAYQAVAASGLMQSTPGYIGGQNQMTTGMSAMISRQSNLLSGGRRNEGLRDHDRPRIRERRSPRKWSRSPVRKKSRSPPRRSKTRSRSRSRSSSPQRSRRSGHSTHRYNVQVPKISLDLKEATVMSLRSRYTSMYIPSDFFNASLKWTEVFPLYHPLELGHACQFHVMDKTAECPLNSGVIEDSATEPSDADYRFSAKVMLLSMSSIEVLYRQSCALAEDSGDTRESFQHPTRLIQFLVGLRGKSEPMAVGGPWSPSLDGPNPDSDPQVLINTAIRTTRRLTGIDLSKCTQWFSFAEIRYHRQEEVRKGRTVPAHVETVVIFLPDVWTCCPTRLDWQATVAAYRGHVESKLLAAPAEGDEDSSQAESKEEETVTVDSIEKKEPTHYSELDAKNMTVALLRQELEARGVTSKGLKSQLIARLVKVLKTEQEREEDGRDIRMDFKEDVKEEEVNKPDEKDEETRKKEAEEKRQMREKERESLERKYALPNDPHVIVHPSSAAKSGRFDCTVMSLSVLLDYRPEDNKEHSFEVSLFAELFNEMLMRDFGFQIYKALVSAPNKTDEDKKEDTKKKTDEDKKEDTKKKTDEDKKDDGKKKTDEDKKEDGKKKTDDKKKSEDKSKTNGNDKDKAKSVESATEAEKSSEDTAMKTKEPEKEMACDDGDKDDDQPVKSDKKETESDLKAPARKKSRWSATTSDDKKDDEPSSSKSEKAGDSERKSSRKTKEEREKMFTMDPGLLLSFVYFDQSHAGYLLEKDLEDILYIIGLQLSRGQVKKLLNKLVSRDQISYRKLTDRTVPKDGNTTPVEAADGSSTRSDEEDRKLALGNKWFLSQKTESSKSPSNGSDDVGTVSSSGLVMLNGALINVDNVMSNLSKSEKARHNIELKMKAIEDECTTLRTDFQSSEQGRHKLSLERDELRRQLRDRCRDLDTSGETVNRQTDLLSRVSSALSTLSKEIDVVVAKPLPPPQPSSSSEHSAVDEKESSSEV